MSTASRVAVCALIVLMLVGCGRMQAHRSAYLNSAEGQTLRIPEGMDTPYRDDSRAIGAVGRQATHRLDPADLARPPAALAVRVDQFTEYAGSELLIADEPGSLWRRTGIALDRSPLVTVLRRDEPSRRMQVELAAESVTARPQSWLGRAFRRQRVTTVAQPPVWVHVAPHAEGGSIHVADDSGQRLDDTRARRVLGILSDRLG